MVRLRGQKRHLIPGPSAALHPGLCKEASPSTLGSWGLPRAPTSKLGGGTQEILMVLVWPRSTEPLTGSTVKPLCCRDETLSRLKSTTCKAGRFWEHRAGSGSQGARRGRTQMGVPGVPKVELHSPFWRSAGCSECSPLAALGWPGGPACPRPAGCSRGSPGCPSAPRLRRVKCLGLGESVKLRHREPGVSEQCLGDGEDTGTPSVREVPRIRGNMGAQGVSGKAPQVRLSSAWAHRVQAHP